MSYILDALKKADAQRERDPARGIHAQPAPLPTLQQPGLDRRTWLWAAAVAGIAALAVAGWVLSQEKAQVPPPAATGDAAPAPERVADAVLPPAAPAAPVAPPVAPPVAAARATAADNAARAAPAAKAPPPPATPAPATSPPVAAAPAAAPAALPPATAAAARPTPPSSPAAPAAPAPAAEPPIGNGLPADAPKLAISGGVYSSNRAQRMLIVNGQVVNEGSDLGGGIVLEEIRPKAAVLRFRGGRYNVGF